MSSYSRKRKHRITEPRGFVGAPFDTSPQFISQDTERSNAESKPELFFQAHEADINRGPKANMAARSLDVFDYDNLPNNSHDLPPHKHGDALIRWGGSLIGSSQPEFPNDENFAIGVTVQQKTKPKDEQAIWVDRYDVRLLLDSLPLSPLEPLHSAPSSPTGWSDLPSDAEDTFFFSLEEVDDYRRDKKRRLMDQIREERLKARAQEDDEDVSLEENSWGGSDEEPDAETRELIQRTATHILSSPNPAQLEIRILANYGADKRFAFLRGRWSRSWGLAKAKVRVEQKSKESEKAKQSVLGGLGDYGDSDEENNSAPENDSTEKTTEEIKAVHVHSDDVKDARRLRAKEWAEKRKARKSESC